jgi:hypothetical protein
MMSSEQRTAYSVTGPYRYPEDAHECFRIDGPAGIAACVYAYDDYSMAEQRALVMAEALEVAFAKST